MVPTCPHVALAATPTRKAGTSRGPSHRGGREAETARSPARTSRLGGSDPGFASPAAPHGAGVIPRSRPSAAAQRTASDACHVRSGREVPFSGHQCPAHTDALVPPRSQPQPQRLKGASADDSHGGLGPGCVPGPSSTSPSPFYQKPESHSDLPPRFTSGG